jgi:AcrR family transcriptional regulator
MVKRTTKGAQTRALILETAFELFSDQGYHATTMRQIAKQSALAPGSIYNHFPGKDDLFLSVLRTYHPLNQIAPLLAEATGETSEEYIRFLAHQMMQVMDDQSGLVNLSFIELVELDGQHFPAMVETFRPQIMAFVERLSAGPEQLRVSPLEAFRFFLGLLLAHELTDRLLQTALGDEITETGNLDDFIDVYLHGILQAEKASTQGE